MHSRTVCSSHSLRRFSVSLTEPIQSIPLDDSSYLSIWVLRRRIWNILTQETAPYRYCKRSTTYFILQMLFFFSYLWIYIYIDRLQSLVSSVKLLSLQPYGMFKQNPCGNSMTLQSTSLQGLYSLYIG